MRAEAIQRSGHSHRWGGSFGLEAAIDMHGKQIAMAAGQGVGAARAAFGYLISRTRGPGRGVGRTDQAATHRASLLKPV